MSTHTTTTTTTYLRATHAVAWLAVVSGNARARRFYERCGWNETGPILNPAETSTGTMLVPALRYEKTLTVIGSRQ
jgi:hypothetical protein